MDERQPYPPGHGGSGLAAGGGAAGGLAGGSGGSSSGGMGGSHVGGGGGTGGAGGDPCASPFASGLCLPREGCVSAAGCDDVVLLLHFDQQSAYGETAQLAHDFSERGNDATCSADCPTHAPSFGRYGGSYDYTSDERFSVAHDASISFDDVVTVAVWFYPRTMPADWTAAVGKIVDGDASANFWLGHNDDRFCVSYHSGVDWHNECSATHYATDQWYLLVGTWDDPNDTFRVYVNGALAAQENNTADMPETTTPITIGWSPGDPGVDGYVDEVVIWNRLLSDDEIAALYSPP